MYKTSFIMYHKNALKTTPWNKVIIVLTVAITWNFNYLIETKHKVSLFY